MKSIDNTQKYELIKSRLIILSDLFGFEKSDWIKNYLILLENKFDVKHYDCCELGEINKTDYSEKKIHKQFLNGGIEKAIQNLLKHEKTEIHILAFSIGGLIGWKSALLNLKIKNIFALSSTRLRNEVEKPNCEIELFYGEKDKFQPEIQWFTNIGIERQILENQEHNFYKNPEVADKISKIILKKIIT